MSESESAVTTCCLNLATSLKGSGMICMHREFHAVLVGRRILFSIGSSTLCSCLILSFLGTDGLAPQTFNGI